MFDILMGKSKVDRVKTKKKSPEEIKRPIRLSVQSGGIAVWRVLGGGSVEGAQVAVRAPQGPGREGARAAAAVSGEEQPAGTGAGVVQG